MFKKIGAVALSTGLVLSAMSVPAFAEKPESPGKGHGHAYGLGNGNGKDEKKIENIIYMIPDGFSTDYASNYRVYKGEDAVWDAHLKGLFTTHSANADVTDSAAAGTAMASGVKTNNGVIGLDSEGNDVTTILDASEEAGKASGLVATSTITHATPASFATSVENRNNQTEIARQYISGEVDVLLGGGKNMFLPEAEGGNQEESNLIEEAQDAGVTYVETSEELQNNADIDVEEERLLGLFADDALSPELHRDQTVEPSLAEMTETSIEVLEQDKDGFFLMVEGSQIDWAGHANDSAWAMSDVAAFEKAVEEAIDFAEQDGNTLVIVAGDHDTGGMTTGSGAYSGLNADILNNVTATGDSMAAQLNEDRSNAKEIVEEYTNVTLTEEEVQSIQDASDAAFAINTVVSDHAGIGWTTTNHTGADIPIYAYGPQAEKFAGFHDNTDLPKTLADILRVNLDN
ncbi:alkaline phosphatase [Gracilibacillus orientalis]|uniref:Alkaline phosphatase n=1 Tax=Gracilibacillus orientalis TaxID=334253 RepID=A0A1I4IW35_9BACI|nr:alkaline phosphatase [Gracilibacillus orientalis]SFL58524.1 alkaline phosphatase [Gracilibacillus orientalis]